MSGIAIQRSRILKGMAVPESKEDSYLIDMIDELIVQCLALCSPKGKYSIHRQPVFKREVGIMQLDEFDFKLGTLVTSFLKKSSHIATFVSTCGPQVEQFSKEQFKQGHFLEGLIIDLIGSEIADKVSESVHKAIECEAAKLGMRVTNRYSPGYCNWPVSDQHKLFSLIRGEHCGIRLTEGSLMMPIKSVSGIVGIGKNVKMMGYTCKYCDDEKCLLRKEE